MSVWLQSYGVGLPCLCKLGEHSHLRTSSFADLMLVINFLGKVLFTVMQHDCGVEVQHFRLKGVHILLCVLFVHVCFLSRGQHTLHRHAVFIDIHNLQTFSFFC